MLRGTGRIAFGHSVGDTSDEVVVFSMLG